MDAQVLADELGEPESGLFVVHYGVGPAFVAGRLQVREIPAVSFCSHLRGDVFEAVLKPKSGGAWLHRGYAQWLNRTLVSKILVSRIFDMKNQRHNAEAI